jgi:hypothetical protein
MMWFIPRSAYRSADSRNARCGKSLSRFDHASIAAARISFEMRAARRETMP